MTAPPWSTAYSVDIDGDSAQNAVGNVVNGDLVQRMTMFVRGRPTMYLGSAEIADRLDCYVPPRNHDLIVKALKANRLVALTGPHGCGRETAAIAAIRHLSPDIAIRRFSLEDEDTEEIEAKGSCGYLIHAADGGLSRLARCVDAIRTANGYLAVVGDIETDRRAAAAPLSWLAIEPPHPLEVYRRRVTVRGCTAWLQWDEAPLLLKQALPADARRLADLVEQVAPHAGDITARRAEVAQAYRGWADELRGWFDEHREPHDRALLLAAAALPPATEDSYIYSAASALAERLQITINGTGLAWCPVTGLRALLRADQEDGRVVFLRHGFAESALRHTLADYPLARPDVLSWLAALPTDRAVQNEQQNSLAGTFADLAADHDAAELITETAGKWGRDGLADLAFIALSRTCLHPRVGGRVRRALYDWARTPGTAPTLKLTIARICEPLGQTYPSIALTRLKHLATYGSPQVRDEVIQAALTLDAFGHHAEVLTAALNWCAETNKERLPTQSRQRRRRAGTMLFLKLAQPLADYGIPKVLVNDRATDPEVCTPGWRTVLDFYAAASGTRDNAIEDVVWRWLDAALCHTGLREPITSVFIEAASPSTVPHQLGSAIQGPTTAQIMINMVQQWAALDPTDPVRRNIKEDIVIPLTQPGWLRMLNMLYVQLRALANSARTHRTQ